MNTNAPRLEHWFRRFLLVLVALLCLGTAAELVLEKHYKETLQLIPFGLCFVGLASVLAVLARPQRVTIWLMRVIMIALVLGSVLGGYLHLRSNVEFVTEMRPNTPIVQVVLTALSGAAPLLAPGMLALAGVLALGATYYHPALARRAGFESEHSSVQPVRGLSAD